MSIKIIFWGTPEMAVPTLSALYEAGHQIQAIVTQPDRAQGRHRSELIFSPVKIYGTAHHIPILQPESAKDEQFFGQLQAYAPDMMILVAYGQILQKRILNLAPYGFLNIHFALLPKHRGASPISSAILNGDAETGISVMKIVPKIDAGPVYGTAKCPIMPDDTRGTLEEKLAKLAPPVLLSVIESIVQGTATPQDQDHTQATFCKPVQKRDGIINWTKPASYLERYIRAMAPWPMAVTTLHRMKDKQSIPILIHQAEVIRANTPEFDRLQELTKAYTIPYDGKIIQAHEQGIDVAAGQEFLRIIKLQRSGKNILLAKEFLKGSPLIRGDYFGEQSPSSHEIIPE